MELKTSFTFDWKAKAIKNTSESTVFVSHIDYNDTCFACAGNGFVKLYDINTGDVDTYFGTGQKAVNDIQFANKHPEILCTASSGKIGIYDTRTNNKKNSKNKSKVICLLRSPNKSPNHKNRDLYSVTMDDHIIVGSGKKEIYLWDIRMVSNADVSNAERYKSFTLNDCHCDDVTKVLFNTFNENDIDKKLFSISEDTLLNEYNLDNKETDNVLVNTYSLEKELWNFGFFKHRNEFEFVYALTNDESLIVQQINNNNNDNKDDDDDTKQSQNIGMNGICTFESNALDNMTLIDCFFDYNSYKELCLLSCKQGKLRLSSVSPSNVTILSESNDGHQARIRCAKYIPKIGCIVTGGEDNKVSIWKFDPINIKPQILPKNENNNTPKRVTGTRYGAQRASNNYNKTKHFSPY